MGLNVADHGNWFIVFSEGGEQALSAALYLIKQYWSKPKGNNFLNVF